MDMNKVLICGDRNWTDHELIRSWLSKLQDWGYTILIEGEARGADSIARDEAKSMGYVIEPYPANWARYGRGAGPIRNRQMVDEGHPNLVVYFHHNLAVSKGTRNMVNYATSCGITVIDGCKGYEGKEVNHEG